MKTREEVKKKARELLEGKLWVVLKPMLLTFIIAFALGLFGSLAESPAALEDVGGKLKMVSHPTVLSMILDIVASIASILLSVGTIGYILKFVRGKKPTLKDVFTTIKDKWLLSLLTSLISTIFIVLGYVCLIIPGIIITFGLSMITYLMADKNEFGPMNVVRKSWEMMKGHKTEYFIYGLSFFGWCLLSCLTFGILFIYVAPYMAVTMALYYEELKKLTK